MKALKSAFAPSLNRMIKFGRRTPVAPGHKFRLRNYLRASLPAPPTSCDYSPAALKALAQMYGNDSLGDCVIAGGYHIEGVETGNAGDMFIATQVQIIKDYEAIGGYVPGDPSTDNGCDEDTATNWWEAHGFANGTKLLGAISADPASITEGMQGLYLFEDCMFGVNLPDAWVNPMPSKSGFVWDVAGDPNPDNGHCFTGDTKVSLLDGRELSLKDLAEGVAGESFGVYSCDSEGNVVPGRAHSARLTRKNVEIVKVRLDNDEAVRCTADHLFMLRDGSYREARLLQSGDSLMPLYRRIGRQGYEEFANPRTHGWHLTHRMVAFGIGEKSRKLAVHHHDFNKLNNSPENLKILTKTEHSRLHEETSEHLLSYAQSDKGRSNSRDAMRRLWDDPVWKTKMDAGLAARTSAGGKATIAAGHGLRGMPKEVLRAMSHENGMKSIERLTSPENLKKAAEGLRRRLEFDPALREQLRIRALAASKTAQGLPITDCQREARRRNAQLLHKKRNQAQVQEVESVPYNHQVASVEPAGFEDVYDLTVEEHHNFALTSGVFVHNCFIGYGYTSKGILISTWGMTGLITWAAVAKYCAASAGGQLLVLLTPDQLAKGQAKAPNGVAWTDLISDFDTMGGHVPVPAPVPTPPTPIPPAPTPTPPAPTPPKPTPTPTPPAPTPPAVGLKQAIAWAMAGLSPLHPVLTKTQAESAVTASLAKNWPAQAPVAPSPAPAAAPRRIEVDGSSSIKIDGKSV